MSKLSMCEFDIGDHHKLDLLRRNQTTKQRHHILTHTEIDIIFSRAPSSEPCSIPVDSGVCQRVIPPTFSSLTNNSQYGVRNKQSSAVLYGEYAAGPYIQASMSVS